MVLLNKRGQTQVFFILMMGIIFFILGLALTPAISQTNSEVTNTAELNCSLDNLTKVQKSVCVQTDMFAPYYLGILLGLAGLILGGIATQ